MAFTGGTIDMGTWTRVYERGPGDQVRRLPWALFTAFGETTEYVIPTNGDGHAGLGLANVWYQVRPQEKALYTVHAPFPLDPDSKPRGSTPGDWSVHYFSGI